MSGILNKASLSLTEATWMTQKIKEVKQHAAWNENLDEIASERLLLNEAPFTFILRPGKDMYHYFLSYVEADGTIHHKTVKIELSVSGWLYRNGGPRTTEKIDQLIPIAMHCAPEERKPYRMLTGPVFSI